MNDKITKPMYCTVIKNKTGILRFGKCANEKDVHVYLCLKTHLQEVKILQKITNYKICKQRCAFFSSLVFASYMCTGQLINVYSG